MRVNILFASVTYICFEKTVDKLLFLFTEVKVFIIRLLLDVNKQYFHRQHKILGNLPSGACRIDRLGGGRGRDIS